MRARNVTVARPAAGRNRGIRKPALTGNLENQLCIYRPMLVRTLDQGDFYADILTGLRAPEPYFIYVVQRRGSADVLAMGHCHSEKEAVAVAKKTIERLRRMAASA